MILEAVEIADRLWPLLALVCAVLVWRIGAMLATSSRTVPSDRQECQ